MITLTVQANTYQELVQKMMGFMANEEVAGTEIQVEIPTDNGKRKPGRPRKAVESSTPAADAGASDPMTPASTKAETPAPATSAPPGGVATAPAVDLTPTFDNMKSLLQKVAQLEKDTQGGFSRVLKLIKPIAGVERIREIKEEHYPAIIAAAAKELKL
jgi:hypothetical protein